VNDEREIKSLFILLAFLTRQGCAEVSPTPGNKILIPLKKANLEAVFG
jgi:hypothetical protein